MNRRQIQQQGSHCSHSEASVGIWRNERTWKHGADTSYIITSICQSAMNLKIEIIDSRFRCKNVYDKWNFNIRGARRWFVVPCSGDWLSYEQKQACRQLSSENCCQNSNVFDVPSFIPATCHVCYNTGDSMDSFFAATMGKEGVIKLVLHQPCHIKDKMRLIILCSEFRY